MFHGRVGRTGSSKGNPFHVESRAEGLVANGLGKQGGRVHIAVLAVIAKSRKQLNLVLCTYPDGDPQM